LPALPTTQSGKGREGSDCNEHERNGKGREGRERGKGTSLRVNRKGGKQEERKREGRELLEREREGREGREREGSKKGGKCKGREARREQEPEGKEWGRTCAEILEAPSGEGKGGKQEFGNSRSSSLGLNPFRRRNARARNFGLFLKTERSSPLCTFAERARRTLPSF
jgi:hypothetical protein